MGGGVWGTDKYNGAQLETLQGEKITPKSNTFDALRATFFIKNFFSGPNTSRPE